MPMSSSQSARQLCSRVKFASGPPSMGELVMHLHRDFDSLLSLLVLDSSGMSMYVTGSHVSWNPPRSTVITLPVEPHQSQLGHFALQS